MKKPFVMTFVAMTTAMAFAQNVQDTTAQAKAPADSAVQAIAPADSTAQATPAVKADSTAQAIAPADSAVQAIAPADSTAQVTPVVKTDSTVQAAAPVDSMAQAVAPADSAVQAVTPADTTKQASAPVDSLKQATAPVDSTVKAQPTAVTMSEPSVFVPDAEVPVVLLKGTKIGGNMRGFLKADNSPYLVEHDIFVEPHAVLVIEPGVVLEFSPGTALNVQGQLIVAGNRNQNVIMKSAATIAKNGDWKGIYLSGDKKSEIHFATISGAENGILLENSKLSMQSSTIEKTTVRGVFARNSDLSISDSYFFDNEGIALQLANHSLSDVERTKFVNNKVAFENSELAQTDLTTVAMEENEVAVVDKGNSYLTFTNSSVTKNKLGASSKELLEKSVLASVFNNVKDFDANVDAILSNIPADPEIPGVDVRRMKSNEDIKDLMAQHAESESDTTAKSWSIIGNVMLGGNYHYVQTRRNHSHTPDIVGEDTIFYKKHYKNTFQVPGFGAEASAYLLMTSPEGKTFEFSTDLTADSWNHFSPNPVTLTYKDSKNQVILGDHQKIGGDIYMSSMPLFGIDYTLSLLKNNADQPLLQLNAFGGENRKPYLLGDRHPYLYNDYIEDGETQAQRMVYGGEVKWAPLRRFDATLGILYANDEIEDPLFRDGSSSSDLTSEPMQKSLTAYADGNWLFYPGDIELKGMIAVGRADTAQVETERAINRVFSEEGISVSNYTTLRKLMEHKSLIATLSNEELQEIFGESSTLNPSEMRTLLADLIDRAKKAKKESEDDTDDGRVAGLNWGSQNFAIGASLYWKIYKTQISGHIKYVGEDFYSVGSPDQLSDTREFGGELEQFITNFWTLNFSYDLNVENAANGSKTNLLGLGEGTRWGLFADESSSWFDEHELDNDRTKYIQKFDITNSFKINDRIDLKVGYNLEYRSQNRPTQLHGSYLLEDGIYKDKWFKARKGKATTTITDNGEEYEVDEERWSEYTSTYTAEYLASGLEEKSLKHVFSLNASLKACKSVFKAGGRWTVRSDISEFEHDSLASKFNLADTTWEKLGYYFNGADYFEQSYPLSVTTTLEKLQNRASVTPRFKSYTRDNMSEAEITIEDEFEMPFLNRFLIFSADAQFRYLSTSYDDGDDTVDESETDLTYNLNLRVNHTKALYSEWFTGAGFYYRPDNRSDEYKDIFGGVRVNYAF